MQIHDYSHLIFSCRQQLHRIGLTWKSPRVLDFCERATGHRDAHYLSKQHLQVLLTKLQAEPTPQKEDVA
jgi:hypothetical protein